MQTHRSGLSCLVGLIGLSLIVPTGAHAADLLEEVTVTARKRAESLQETPISITALTNDDIQLRAINDASQIAEYTPNMVFDFTSAINPTSSAAAIYIRGVGQPDWSLPTDPGVGLYLDGVYIARSVGAVLDVADVQTVEVLRGPQGTLFGRNTIGGAINVISRKPSSEFEGTVRIGAGSFRRVNAYANFNLPINDQLFFKVAGSSKTADGFVKNQIPGQPDWGDEDSRAWRAALRWEPTEDLSIQLTYDSTEERETHTSNIHLENFEDAFLPLVYNGVIVPPDIASNPTRFGIVPDPACADFGDASRLTNPTCFNSQWTVTKDDPYKVWGVLTSNVPELNTNASRPLEPAADLDLYGFALNVDWNLTDDLTLVSITAIRDLEGYWVRDEDGSPMEIVSTVNDFDQDQFSQEIQLKGTALDGRVNWILGGFYFEEDGCHLDLVYLYGSTFSSGGCIDNESIAGFAQATWDINDRWSLTGGARYTDEEKSFTPDQIIVRDELFGFPAGFEILPSTKKTVKVDEPDFHINLSYSLTEDVMAYASYSDSFKGATFTQRIFPPLPEVPTADPEFVDSYEVGLKSTLFDGRVRLNGAVFFSQYDDIQVTVLEEGAAGNTTANAAEGEIFGAELEITAAPVDNVRLELGVGYLDAEYTKVAGTAAAAGLTTSTQFVNTPEWSINSAASYDFQIRQGWALTPRVEWNFQSETFNDSQNFAGVTQSSVGLWNASLNSW
jgi:iron complex outermembrane receptor protein